MIQNQGITNNQTYQVQQEVQVQEMVPAAQRYFVDILDPKEKKFYDNFIKKGCCGEGIIGNIIYLIVYLGINFVFIIAALATLINKNAHYVALNIIACPSSSNMLSSYLPSYASSMLNGILGGDAASFKTFWCEIGSVENGVLISYLIFIILFLAFEILSLLIHKKVINLGIEGILYYILVSINLLFLVLFYIYIPLLFYSFVYCIIVAASSPFSVNAGTDRTESIIEENWDKNKAIPIVNSILVFCIFILNFGFLSIKKTIILYLSLRYEDENNSNEKVKTTTLRINSKEEKAEVKANQVLYLQRVGQADKIYKFKEMKLANYPDNNIYVQLNNKAITDQLSFTSWEYPDLDELFKNLGDIVSHIYTILFFSIALFKMHLNNEYNYLQLSASLEALSISYGSSSSEIMPKFHGVFTSYGGFEVGTTNSRFALYIIALFIILLSMLKRMFFGGYSRPILVLIVFILSVVFILENIIYGILSLLMIVFSILSVVCYYDMNKGSEAVLDEMIQAKLYIQMILNVIIFSLCMKILSLNAKLTSALNQLRKEVNHLYDGTPSEEQENIKGFQYKGLDGQEHVLNELKIEGHPRYVYYTMYNDINNVHENRAILPNDSSGRNESNINTNNIHIEVRPNQPVVSASGPAQTIHVRPNQSVVPASGPAQSIQDMMIENGNLRETNRKLNEELNRLRSNLANLYNSINNNM